MRGFAAQHLLPAESGDIQLSQGSSIAKAAEVASQMVRPVRSAAIHAPSGTFTPLVVPFHTKHRVMRGIVQFEIGNLAVGRFEDARILEFQLLDRVRCPNPRKSFPRRTGQPAWG